MFFYDEAISLSGYDYIDIFTISLLNFKYSEARLAFVLFGSLAKLASSLGVTDILLFLKFHVAFVASLIPVIAYKIILLKRTDITGLHRKLLVFALISPLLIYSCQLLRDIHVCLLFTIMFYVALFSRISWMVGAVLGGILGQILPVKLEGIDFCMTALFITIAIDQWRSVKVHLPALAGFIGGVLLLLLIGKDYFLLPTLILVSGLLLICERKVEAHE